jgi:hypothetical protein
MTEVRTFALSFHRAEVKMTRCKMSFHQTAGHFKKCPVQISFKDSCYDRCMSYLQFIIHNNPPISHIAQHNLMPNILVNSNVLHCNQEVFTYNIC